MRIIKMIMVMLFSIAIAACGGGGGSSSPTPAATYSISGAVSGAVLPGVAISLTGTSIKSTTTDAMGNYTFTGLANGSYTVTPSLAGNSFSPAGTAVSVSGANVSNTNFVAAALGVGASTYSISGTVSGAATSGVTLTLSGANTGSQVSGAGGTYTFSNLLAGSYTVTPSLTGFTFTAPITVTIVAANSTANNFTATAVVVPHSISGNVSPSLAGVTIDVTGAANASTTTDASGNYTVTGLFDGIYNVVPSKAGYTFAPNSTSVTMAGANVTVPSFAGTANSSVLATVNGSVTGAWVEGITVTMSGCASGTFTTNASGTYSFANVPSGTTCTFTATPLAGYNYTTGSATLPGGSSTTVTASNIVASSIVTSDSVSGTVINNSGKTGRIYILAYDNNCTNCSPSASTSIASAGAYMIRGLRGSNYRVEAQVDARGTGVRNATNPVGSAFSGAGGSGVNITINPLTLAPAATAPTGLGVSPSNGAAFVRWNPVKNAGGLESVAAYKIYWGTDANATSGAPVIQMSGDNSFYAHSGLSNGAVLYYKVSSCVSSTCAAGTESPASAVIGPVTLTAPTVGNTVSGTVTVAPGITAAPMIVGLYGNTGIYFTRIASASNAQAYTITGVPNGSYYNFAFVDRDGNGTVSAGDLSNTNGDAPVITVNANVTNANLTLNSANATARIGTDHESANYSLIMHVGSQAKLAVTATVISGANIPVPFDIGVDPLNDGTWVWINSVRPTVGDSYKIRVTYSDGTHDDMTSSVTGVSDSFAQNLVEQTTAPGTPAIPLLTWAAPLVTPSTPYTYDVYLQGNNNGVNWRIDTVLPSSATSVLYNVDGRASAANLTTGAYTWEVTVRDSNHNQTRVRKIYNAP
ncbi:MAG: hypothetical protein HOO95_01025 [Gallionella sp.]|nr:hypothetical protein [Gallionella sp.]